MKTRTQITLTIILAGTVLLAIPGWTDPTPPIMPTIVETPLPAPVTLPALETIPADVPNTPLTAAEAAQIALRHQSTITGAHAGLLAAQARLQQTRAGLRAGVVLSTGYNNSPITPSSGTPSTSSGFVTGATVRQLLFDYNHTRDLVRQSVEQERLAVATLTRTQSDLVFQVKQAFYTVVQNARLVTVNEANLRNRQQHLDLTKARVKEGVGLPADVVRAETAVSDAILSLNLAQNSVLISRVVLAQAMGLDPRTPIVVGDAGEPPVATDDINTLFTLALRQRPELAQLQATLRANQLGVTVAKSTNAPQVSGTVGWNARAVNFTPNDGTLVLGVAVTWNAFDGGLMSGKIKEAQANVIQAQALLVTTQQTVVSDVSQAYLNLKTAEQRVVTADAEVANAEEGVRLSQGRYNAGLGIFLDVLDAQAALVTAQTNRVNAQTAVNQARAALAHAVNADPVANNAVEK